MHFLTPTTLLSLLILSASALPASTCNQDPAASAGTKVVKLPSTKSNTTATAPKNTPSATGKANTTLAPGALVPASLVPVFSIKAGSGIGANNVAIPKQCPPARVEFISKLSVNVAAGNVLGTKIAFNADVNKQDVQTNKDRATAMIITLQSFTGKKGVGCPGASTPELIAQQKTGVVGLPKGGVGNAG